MALPSQSKSSSSSFRSANGGWFKWVGLVLLIVALGVGLWVWTRGEAPVGSGTTPPDGTAGVGSRPSLRDATGSASTLTPASTSGGATGTRTTALGSPTNITPPPPTPGSTGTATTTSSTGTTPTGTGGSTLTGPATTTYTAGTPGSATGTAAAGDGSATPGTSTATDASSTGTSPGSSLPLDQNARLQQGMRMIEQGQLVEARDVLSDLLLNEENPLPARDAQAVRDTLSSINQDLIFSTRVVPGDPVAEYYSVNPGDFLSRVAPRYGITYQLIERINKVDSRRLRVGQKLKVIRGPAHAIVSKSDFRMDIYLHSPNGKKIYVRSFPIGLGEDNSTPVGAWRIASGGKVVKPTWTNPRTGEFFAADDPKNPLGGYWLRLEGTGQRTTGLQGYGIHGTIEPESIGKQMSMGCIRMGAEDIALIYEMLVDGQSTVTVKD